MKVTLSLFNKRVERLERTMLARRMDDNPRYTLKFDAMLRREWVAIDGVTEDDVDAFVLNLRLLIQDTDKISIRCLYKDVYSLPNAPGDLRARFIGARNDWQKFRDAQSVFVHPVEQRNFQQGELFDVLLYGVLAHVNADKFQLGMQMTTQGAVSALMASWFLSALRETLRVVRVVRDTNLELLERAGPAP